MTKPESESRLFRRTLVVMAAIGTAVVLWQLNQLILVLFASALVALMFHDFAVLMQRRLKLPFALALLLAVVVPLVSLVAIFGLFGSLMFDQFSQLAQQLPAAVREAEGWLRDSRFGREALRRVQEFAPNMNSVFGWVQVAVAGIGSALSGLAVVLVAGIYIAAQPKLYAEGTLAMLPPKRAERLRHILQSLREALTSWLKGQAIGMLFVAVATSIGLALIGLPSAFAIGLIAGLCEFVPYLGVVVVTLPTIILGFGQDMQTGWLTVVVLLAVQQLQGNLIMPIAQRRFGDLPPVLTIFSLIAAGALMGPLGVVLAVPLTVVAVALIKVLLAERGRETPLANPDHPDASVKP